ncbi:hypothetical protein SDC49_01265 [Lactobacillus sp. R2/2]|nr:hypothetical protein [Lactobacillus sp. R2/2]
MSKVTQRSKRTANDTNAVKDDKQNSVTGNDATTIMQTNRSQE